MEKYFKHIDKQIEFSKGKNIFYSETDIPLKFIDDTIKAISEIDGINTDSQNILIDFAADKAIEEFCRINQYYTFNNQAKNDLRNIYRDLFSNITTKTYSIEIISKNHYQNLKKWLRKTNPFADKLYSNTTLDLKPVACSEYHPDFQINILKIDYKALMEPVLDIGCGKQGNLVKYLNENGIKQYSGNF